MGTLQENQSLNAEYERNKKEREMKENIEYLNYCNEQLEKTNKNLNYKVEKLEEDYLETKDNFRVANDEIERLNNIINKALRKLRASKDHFITERENNAVTFTIKILEESDKE